MTKKRKKGMEGGRNEERYNEEGRIKFKENMEWSERYEKKSRREK